MFVSARDRYLWTTYGLREHDYIRLLEAQGGVCAISGRPGGTRSLHVDHLHVPKYKAMPPEMKRLYVRGLLAYRMNKGIGWFSDNSEWLSNAARYVDDWPASKVLM